MSETWKGAPLTLNEARHVLQNMRDKGVIHHHYISLVIEQLIALSERQQKEIDELRYLFTDRVLDSEIAARAVAKEREACANLAGAMMLCKNHEIAEAIRMRTP